MRSFTYAVKKEICKNSQTRHKWRMPQTYGLCLFGRSFDTANISLHTEHKAVARYYTDSIFYLASLSRSITLREKLRAGRAPIYVSSVDDYDDRMAVLKLFGYGGGESALTINWGFLSKESWPMFLSGVFLACGAIEDPAKGYRAEFSTPHRTLCEDLSKLLCEGLCEPKMTTRRNRYVLYYKESGQIEDLLTYMGASASTLSMMQAKILKDVRNNVNRQTNCETANISKTVNASMEQRRAIEALNASGRLAQLDEQTRELARLRENHPEFSLRELGEAMNPPLSRSAVNHRISRILSAAKSIRRGMGDT